MKSKNSSHKKLVEVTIESPPLQNISGKIGWDWARSGGIRPDRAGSGQIGLGSGKIGQDRVRSVGTGQPILVDLDRYWSISANIFKGGIST